MSGYLGDAGLTAAKLRGGEVATGDFFTVDDAGEFTFVGRRDDLVKRKDHRVFLSEIEAAVSRLDGVAGAAVVGLRREGEEPSVAVFFVPRAGCTAARLQDLCRAHLAFYKVPDAFFPLPALPVTDSGKVDREKLRRLFQERYAVSP